MQANHLLNTMKCPKISATHCSTHTQAAVTHRLHYITLQYHTQNTARTRRPLIHISLLANSWQFKLLTYIMFYQSVFMLEIRQLTWPEWFVKSNRRNKNWPVSETSREVWHLLAWRRKVSRRHPCHHRQWHHSQQQQQQWRDDDDDDEDDVMMMTTTGGTWTSQWRHGDYCCVHCLQTYRQTHTDRHTDRQIHREAQPVTARRLLLRALSTQTDIHRHIYRHTDRHSQPVTAHRPLLCALPTQTRRQTHTNTQTLNNS